MKNAFSHSKHCFTCGKQRQRKNLGYDLETLKTYCNDSECFKGELLPLDGEEVRKALYASYDHDFVIALDRMLGKPLSTRLQPYLAMHLMKTAEVQELTSFNEVLLFILNDHFERNEVKNFTLPEWTEYPETEVCEDCEEPEEITYTTIPEENIPVIAIEPIEEPEEPEEPEEEDDWEI